MCVCVCVCVCVLADVPGTDYIAVSHDFPLSIQQRDGMHHRWSDFWTQRSTLKTEKLLRSAVVHGALTLGQMGKDV
jgi:hypothetical protein